MDNDIIIHGSQPMLGTSDFAKLRAADGLYIDKRRSSARSWSAAARRWRTCARAASASRWR